MRHLVNTVMKTLAATGIATAAILGVTVATAAPATAATRHSTTHHVASKRVATPAVHVVRFAGVASASNVQAMVNSCRGAVDGSSVFGVSGYFLIRWSCGGSTIPRNAGAKISIAGVTYVSSGIVQVNDSATGRTIIPNGYDAYIQTSGNGSERTKITLGLRRV